MKQDNAVKPVISNQTGIHDNLQPLVSRHLNTAFKRPYPEFSLQTFAQAQAWISNRKSPIIFDSYCGVGESTVALAKQHPEASVIGLDKSLHRLNKHDEHYRKTGIDNYLLLRADVDDFWRLALEAGWQLSHHYIFYPNPWPKSSQLKRRCHGSPLLPTLLALGGQLELRSNWPLYVEEFQQALSWAGHTPTWERFTPTSPITPFERKYSQAGQNLFRCHCLLSQ